MATKKGFDENAETVQVEDVIGRQPEQSFEVGADEAWKAKINYVFESLIKHDRRIEQHYDKLIADSQAQTSVLMSRAQEHHDQAMKSTIENMARMNQQAQENHRIGFDHTWAGTDTAQGGVDVATLGRMFGDEASLKAIGASIANAVLDALNKNKD
jgi:hypothetical protein